MKQVELPAAPTALHGSVKAWSAPLVIPTYEPAPADRNPMFLEKRVFQGSSGRVYPLPFFDRIGPELHDKSWTALHIENEYLRVTVLPELGGRIYAVVDKTTGYDLVYRNRVIKPAPGGPGRSLAVRWHRVQLATASPPQYVYANGLGNHGGIRRLARHLAIRKRADEPDEGHARRPPQPRQGPP